VTGTDPYFTDGHPQNFKRKKETPMNKFRFTLASLAVMTLTLFVFSSAQAQNTRSWVSGVGDDLNPCSRTAPCKTFSGAMSKTAVNGVINALDPAGFGAVTITKSVTIDGTPTGTAGILNAGTSGVIINITSATDTRKSVTIKGVTIDGAGSGARGFNIVGATAVHVIDCVIEGQNGSPGHGIDDSRIAGGFLEVNNTTITNNTGNGLNVNPSSGSNSIHLHMSNSRVQGNAGSGVVLGSNVKATIYNSVFTQNVAGIFASQTAGGSTEVNVDHCVVSNNVTGFQANTSGSLIRVSNTTAVNNTTLAFVVGTGLVSSYSNNQTGGLAFPSAPTAPQ
jgi:hypothetical protein